MLFSHTRGRAHSLFLREHEFGLLAIASLGNAVVLTSDLDLEISPTCLTESVNGVGEFGWSSRTVMQMSTNAENFSLEVWGPWLRLDSVLSALLQRIHFTSAALIHIKPMVFRLALHA